MQNEGYGAGAIVGFIVVLAVAAAQAVGLARLGYSVTASDISDGELAEAEKRAIRFR